MIEDVVWFDSKSSLIYLTLQKKNELLLQKQVEILEINCPSLNLEETLNQSLQERQMQNDEERGNGLDWVESREIQTFEVREIVEITLLTSPRFGQGAGADYKIHLSMT